MSEPINTNHGEALCLNEDGVLRGNFNVEFIGNLGRHCFHSSHPIALTQLLVSTRGCSNFVITLLSVYVPHHIPKRISFSFHPNEDIFCLFHQLSFDFPT